MYHWIKPVINKVFNVLDVCGNMNQIMYHSLLNRKLPNAGLY